MWLIWQRCGAGPDWWVNRLFQAEIQWHQVCCVGLSVSRITRKLLGRCSKNVVKRSVVHTGVVRWVSCSLLIIRKYYIDLKGKYCAIKNTIQNRNHLHTSISQEGASERNSEVQSNWRNVSIFLDDLFGGLGEHKYSFPHRPTSSMFNDRGSSCDKSCCEKKSHSEMGLSVSLGQMTSLDLQSCLTLKFRLCNSLKKRVSHTAPNSGY